MSYTVKIPEEERLKLGVPDDVWERTKDLSFICVFHWLDCLYQNYVDEKVAEEMPCSLCPEVRNCKTTPLETFNLASQAFGLGMKSIRPRPMKTKV